MPQIRTERAAARHITSVDPRMARVIATVGPCRVAVRRGRFAALVRTIVGQQVSGKAAASIYARLRTAAGGHITAERLGSLGAKGLRSAGISRQKATYLADLCQHVESGSLRLDRLKDKDDDAVVAELTKVKGLGEWSAQMFLMFVLHRPDILPVGDLGIQNGFRRVYGLRKHPSPQRMTALAQAWRPHRSVGCWYLWRALETAPI